MVPVHKSGVLDLRVFGFYSNVSLHVFRSLFGSSVGNFEIVCLFRSCIIFMMSSLFVITILELCRPSLSDLDRPLVMFAFTDLIQIVTVKTPIRLKYKGC